MKKMTNIFTTRVILKSVGGFFALLLISLVIAQGAVLFGPAILVLVGIPFVIFTVYNFRYGVFILFIYGASLFQIARILDSGLPFGILFDLMICLMFLSVIFKFKEDDKIDFKINEPISRIYLVSFLYFSIQILNPNAVSLSGWLASSRSFTLLLLFFIFISYFDSDKSIKRFVYLWLSVAVVASIYGLQQELFGLMDFEWRYIYASPERYGLFFNWGHMRVFSIFSDPSTFGLFMAFSGLSTLVLAFGPFSIVKKVALSIMSVVILISMSFSGTRTAYAMVMIGVVLFIILNIKNPKVLAGSMILVFGFIILMVGPFYSGPVLRIRSTFNVNEDPSMRVRDTNRMIFQEYIKSHPIGGGVNTTGVNGLKYSPSHTLAGRPPDSGYIKTALELGWVGLIIVMVLHLSVIIKGISNNFILYSSRLKTYNLAFIIPFFSLSVANYTQDAMLQKPIVIPLIATYALMIKITEIDKALIK